MKDYDFEVYFVTFDLVKNRSKDCQEDNHIQQVVFSTYHNALTQICFSCKAVCTSIKKESLRK